MFCQVILFCFHPFVWRKITQLKSLQIHLQKYLETCFVLSSLLLTLCFLYRLNLLSQIILIQCSSISVSFICHVLFLHFFCISVCVNTKHNNKVLHKMIFLDIRAFRLCRSSSRQGYYQNDSGLNVYPFCRTEHTVCIILHFNI